MANPVRFIHLRTHTEHSLLEGAVPVKKLVKLAAGAEMPAIAVTDTPGQVLVQLRSGDALLLARITERSRRELGLDAGQPLWAQIKAVALLA